MNAEIEDDVRKIIDDVKLKGDEAISFYNKKFDNINIKNFQITKEHIKNAYKNVDKETIKSLKYAIENIKKYAEMQKKSLNEFEFENNGVVLGQKIIPIEKIGCYVPGGNYPLPSSALMSIIPVKVAGCKEIIVCSPKIKDVTIVAVDLAGADKIFNIGGVQAIAAMAFGTKQVPKVDKIVGPGNIYVSTAKKILYGTVGIDFIAGPSEVMIIADANEEFVAADLLAQAEHDANAISVLITTSNKFADKVKNQIQKQLTRLKTRKITEEAWKNNGKIIIVNNINEAVKIANEKAPEHLELMFKNYERFIGKFTNYGSMFLGNYSAEVFGDYCSGTNHILPTSKAARYTGGLGVKDFVKFVSYQKVKDKNDKLIDTASKIAEVEGLDAHKKAAVIRK